MQAGTLNRRVLLESRVEVLDTVGDPVPTWALFASVWCAVEPQRGNELVTEQQIHSEVTGRIRIRFLEGVNAKMRATVDGVVYNILAVLDLKDRHEEIHLLTSQGMNEG